MITPKLEALIWEGKAAYKTFIAGGGQKCVLPIPSQHFVIITDLTYFSSMMVENTDQSNDFEFLYNTLITQVTIFSDKNFNRFLFRNNFNFVFDTQSATDTPFQNLPNGSIKHDVYLIHQNNGVSFTFSLGYPFKTFTVDKAKAKTTALAPPLDYGKVGDTDAINVNTSMIVNAFSGTWNFIPVDSSTDFPASTRELAFPVDKGSIIPPKDTINSYAYPILQVGYFLIKGTPTDFGFK